MYKDMNGLSKEELKSLLKTAHKKLNRAKRTQKLLRKEIRRLNYVNGMLMGD